MGTLFSKPKAKLNFSPSVDLKVEVEALLEKLFSASNDGDRFLIINEVIEGMDERTGEVIRGCDIELNEMVKNLNSPENRANQYTAFHLAHNLSKIDTVRQSLTAIVEGIKIKTMEGFSYHG